MNQVVLLTEQQAAEWLGLSVHTLRDWRWRKKGPPWMQVSAKCIRYSVAAVQKWLDNQTCNPLP
jgi:predicted DNA-binding transcriptional regulator AlpA